MSQPTEDLPPAAQFVLYILATSDTKLTWGDLYDETGLPRSTLRDAVTELDRRGLLDKQDNPQDARQTLYTVDEDCFRVDIRPKRQVH